MINQNNTKISRDNFLIEMTNSNIGIGVHYQSIASHPYYQNTYGFRLEDYPVSKKIGEQTVSVPISAALSKDQSERVITAVIKIL
jgi:dTDP-4-amino-4,6-dideoxygalactose transaminase